MKTIYEIAENKSFRQLAPAQREELFARQSELVTMWQDEQDFIKKEEIFDELFDSIKGLIKNMAYKRAERSFSEDQEDFEGIMNLVLVETLIQFDRTLNVPFQPVFIMNVKYAMGKLYRDKSYDVHEETYNKNQRLDSPSPDDHTVTMLDALELTVENEFALEVETTVTTETIVNDLFGENEIKKTIVHMAIQGFKRSQIVSAVNVQGKSHDTVAKQVNRTVSQFKEAYLALTSSN